MISFVCDAVDCVLRILVIQLTLCFPLLTIFVDLSLGQVFVQPSIDLPLLSHSIDVSKFKISTLTSTFTWLIRLLIIYWSITADILFMQPTHLTSSTSGLPGKTQYSTSLSIELLDIHKTTLHSSSLSIEPLDVSHITIASTSLRIEHSDHIAHSINPSTTLSSTDSLVVPCHLSQLSNIESSLNFPNSTVGDSYLKISNYSTHFQGSNYGVTSSDDDGLNIALLIVKTKNVINLESLNWVFPFTNLRHYYKEFTTRRQLNLEVPAGVCTDTNNIHIDVVQVYALENVYFNSSLHSVFGNNFPTYVYFRRVASINVDIILINLCQYSKNVTTKRQLDLDVPAGLHQENDLRRQFRDVVTITKFVPTLSDCNIFQDLYMCCQPSWFIVEFSKIFKTVDHLLHHARQYYGKIPTTRHLRLEVRSGLQNLHLEIDIGMETLFLFMDADSEAQWFQLLLPQILLDWTLSRDWQGYNLDASFLCYRDWNQFAISFWQSFSTFARNNIQTKQQIIIEVTAGVECHPFLNSNFLLLSTVSQLSNLPSDFYLSYIASSNLSDLVTVHFLENTTSSDSITTSSSLSHVPGLRSIDSLSLSLPSWFACSNNTNCASVRSRSFNFIISALFCPSTNQCQVEVFDAMDDLTFYGVLDDTNVCFVLPWIISMMYYVLGLANVKQHLPEARTLLTFLDNTYTESDTAYPVFLVVTLSALKASAYAGEFLLQATSNCAIAVNFLWVLLAFLINPTFFSSIISLRFPVVEQFSVICPILHSFSVFLWIAEKECRQIIRVIAQHRSVYALPSVILWFHISILVPKMCRKLGITIWILQFSTFDAMQPAHFDNAFLLCFGTILTSFTSMVPNM